MYFLLCNPSFWRTSERSHKEACNDTENSHASSQSNFRSHHSAPAMQILWVSGLLLATAKISRFLSVTNGFWHSGHVRLIPLWTLMSVNEFPQKQTAFCLIAFPRQVTVLTRKKILNKQTACITAFSVLYSMPMVFGFAVTSYFSYWGETRMAESPTRWAKDWCSLETET